MSTTTTTTQNPEYTEYSNAEEVFSAIETLILALIVLIMCLIHTYKIYSDFFTNERSVLNYRRNKPPLTYAYKRMGYITLASVWLFFILLFFAAVQYNFSTNGCIYVANIIEKIGYFGSKCLLYYVFVLRLHDVYGNSVYGYSKKKLICVAICLFIISVSLYIIVQVFFVTAPLYVDDTDGSYPWFCQYLMQSPEVMIAGGLMLIYDLAASISAMIAFIIPLKKVVKACEEYKNSSKKNEAGTKRFGKMLYTGYKYKVLVFTASLTTLVWVFFLLIGQNALATYIAQLDYMVNPLCLLLMTPYYPSDTYYERLCIICIFCCDPKRKSYSSKASEKHDNKNEEKIDSTVVKSSMGPSVDTDMALNTKLDVNGQLAYNNTLDVVDENQNTTGNNNKDKEITPIPPQEQDLQVNVQQNNNQENYDDDQNL